MAITAFISYSHADSKHLERLHKHMAQLLRDEVFETWTDHAILAGSKLDNEVFTALRSSQVFIALVSPDYLASNYCYEREFEEAQKLEAAGKLHIVPVIVEPCDWLSSPFSTRMALPTDGKPIPEWTNENVAYLNVIQGLRAVATSTYKKTSNPLGERATPEVGGRRLKIKQEFDTIQRRDFADEAFRVIREYFKTSCEELDQAEDLRARFENMGDNSFTCTVVNRGYKGGRDAHITVHNSKGSRHHFGDINYSWQSHGESNTSNGSVQVDADEYNMFLSLNEFISNDKKRYDAKQVADALWLEFTKQAGIEYD
ncbi:MULTISPECIES: toll/interleukin-1 receptor domain-containing protein [Rhizobium]|uniref:Molecular chaperone Tir n=1 Tax=Rhizobium esperanzae TaxID=1967781 RepID=A0A2D0AB99_9HYPH|nr:MULTISPECIES: toll/interleukin-1 receptor domain-containing protein [Rhizobium]ANK86578.1 TIR domain-containing protein [Rhizobium sp. N731]ANK92494.1 TIR domain-containing protein [Rhizobium sp. N6212]ANK98534.1 TIR domain-containing protein [Rhizobium sp. N621]ANL04613.1 TIR domain-containing protein [Rhizobium esperanzae]ANL10726.1 TIR domain-containing protein [Rhizobium sp. N1341]